MVGLDYRERAYPRLFESVTFRGLDGRSQRALRAFLDERADNLKRLDAERALRWCAARLPALLEPRTPARRNGRRIARADAVLRRGIPAPGGELRPLHDLLEEAAADRARASHIVHLASRRFYVLEWARHAGVHAPDGVADAFRREWTTRQRVGDLAAWLSSNGMTAEELRAEIEDRALEAWLLDQAPSAFGLDRPYLESWADMMGVERPAGIDDAAAFRTWLVERTPNAFGFDQWSIDLQFARELQMTGEIARLAAARAEAAPVLEWRADAGAGAL